MTKQTLKLGWLLGAAIAMVGCGESPQPPAMPETAAADAQIKAIENNPNMPADVKEATLQRLRQQSGQSQAMKDLSSKKGGS